MTILIGCLLMHVMLAQLIPSPWGVPNLTLVGAVLSVADAPSRWVSRSVIAGAWVMLWAARHGPVLGLLIMIIGWGTRRLGQTWDAQDPRLQVVLVAAGTTWFTVVGIVVDRALSAGWLMGAVGHVIVTCASLLVVRLIRQGISRSRIQAFELDGR